MKSSLRWVCLIVFGLISPLAFPQEPKSNASSTSESATTSKIPLVFGLAEDTPVKLKLSRTMSSKDAQVDEKVAFEIVDDVRVGEVLVIQHGGTAIATVTDAKPKSLTHSGKLNINIEFVRLVSGDKAPLRANKVNKGSEGNNAVTQGAMMAASLLLFPTPTLLTKDITIPQGTEITAYIAADTPLDREKFAPPVNASSAVAAVNSSVSIKSTPDGADITVDEEFVGTTPSNIQLASGKHKIVVSKAHFKSWERTMTVGANGSITVNAELEKIP
jgi:hypothetical protein